MSSLSSVTLSYTAAGTDTVDIRAFNGTYWGDWQAVTVTASLNKIGDQLADIAKLIGYATQAATIAGKLAAL